MSDPTTDTPEPVLTVEWWKSTILALILGTVSVLTAFDVWHPSEDQITAITALAGILVLAVFPLVAFFVRKKVTPNAVVDRKVQEALYTPVPIEEAPQSNA